MADYYCFPLWKAGEGEVGNIDPRSLPISTRLQEQLLSWAKAYDQTLDSDYPPNSGFKSAEEKVEFEREAARLAAQLKDELGSEYVIRVQL
jgi:hypothetical protein